MSARRERSTLKSAYLFEGTCCCRRCVHACNAVFTLYSLLLHWRPVKTGSESEIGHFYWIGLTLKFMSSSLLYFISYSTKQDHHKIFSNPLSIRQQNFHCTHCNNLLNTFYQMPANEAETDTSDNRYNDHMADRQWYGWLVFNGTFSTKRLYHAIGE